MLVAPNDPARLADVSTVRVFASAKMLAVREPIFRTCRILPVFVASVPWDFTFMQFGNLPLLGLLVPLSVHGVHPRIVHKIVKQMPATREGSLYELGRTYLNNLPKVTEVATVVYSPIPRYKLQPPPLPPKKKRRQRGSTLRSIIQHELADEPARNKEVTHARTHHRERKKTRDQSQNEYLHAYKLQQRFSVAVHLHSFGVALPTSDNVQQVPVFAYGIAYPATHAHAHTHK